MYMYVCMYIYIHMHGVRLGMSYHGSSLGFALKMAKKRSLVAETSAIPECPVCLEQLQPPAYQCQEDNQGSHS